MTINSAPASLALASLERMPRDDFLAFQFHLLKRQLERLYSCNAFYRNRFRKGRLHPDDIRTMSDFRRRIPLLSKAECLQDQEEFPPFGRRVGVRREQVAMVTLTGGTSGQGQEVYGRTATDITVQAHQHFLPWFMAGLRRGDVAFNCVPTGGLTTGGWGPPDGLRFNGVTTFNVGASSAPTPRST